jgi:hypothetical protein
MAITRLTPPPINVDANDWPFKKWFNEVYQYTKGGVLIPAGGGNGTGAVGNLSPITSRNLLINGDFQIWQRGATMNSTGANPQYTADRWAITRAVNTLTVTQINGPTGFRYGARVARAAGDATTNPIFLVATLETQDSIPIAGRWITCSGWVKVGAGFAAGATPLQFHCNYGTGTDAGPFAAFAGDILVVNLPTNANWTYFSGTCFVPTNSTQLKFYFVWGPPNVAGANNYIDVAGIQVELGVVPTAFEYRTFPEQLKLCERYYQKSFPYGTAPATNNGVAAGGVQYYTKAAGAAVDGTYIAFPTRMRITPTVTFYNYAAANANWRNITRVGDSGVAAASGTGDYGFLLQNPQVAADAVNQLCLIQFDANAEL